MSIPSPRHQPAALISGLAFERSHLAIDAPRAVCKGAGGPSVWDFQVRQARLGPLELAS